MNRYALYIVVLVLLAGPLVGYFLGAASKSIEPSAADSESADPPPLNKFAPYLFLTQLNSDQYFSSSFRYFLIEQMRLEQGNDIAQPFRILKDNLASEERYLLIRTGYGGVRLEDANIGSLSLLELGLLKWLFVSVDFVSDEGHISKKLNNAIADGSIQIEQAALQANTDEYFSSLTPSEVSSLKDRIPSVLYDIE